jgi:hypothetical protein
MLQRVAAKREPGPRDEVGVLAVAMISICVVEEFVI